METSKILNYAEMSIIPYKGIHPRISENVFIASGVKIIGDVEVGGGSSIWYNSVVRGDVNYIKIGELTNIQDLSMLHVTSKKFPLTIGNKVTVGHSVTLHGCNIQSLCLIGMGAVILDGAVVEENSLVAAGSVVKEGFVVPSGKLAAGVPAKIIRTLTENEIKYFETSAEQYRKYSEITVDSLKEIINDR